MRGRTRSTVVVAVLTTVVLLLLLVWSAGNGTPLVSAPEGSFGEPRAETGTVAGTAEAPQEAEDDDGVERIANWSFNLALALWLMALLTTILIVVRWLGRQRLESREHREAAQEEELVALLEATSDEVRYQALSEGDPRNAVVACWVALEEAVHRSGLKPNRSETAAELTHRVLGRWDVDPAAITALSDAYREARFSRHPVSEEQRELAVDALERIHVDLRRRAQEHESVDGMPLPGRESAP